MTLDNVENSLISAAGRYKAVHEKYRTGSALDARSYFGGLRLGVGMAKATLDVLGGSECSDAMQSYIARAESICDAAFNAIAEDGSISNVASEFLGVAEGFNVVRKEYSRLKGRLL